MAIVAFLLFILLAMNIMALPATIYDIGLAYDLSGTQKGSLQLVIGVGAIVAALVGGYASEFFGKRRMLVVGLAIASGSSFLFARAANSVSLHLYWIPLVFLFCLGCGNGIMEGLTNLLTMNLHRKRKTLYLNLGHAFFAVGAILGPIIAGYLTRMSDWRSIFYFNGAFSLVLFSVVVLSPFLPFGGSDGKKVRRIHIKNLIANKEFILVNTSAFLAVGAEIGLVYWLVEYMRTNEHFALSQLGAGFTLSCLWVAILIGRFVYGWLVESTSYRFSLSISCLGGALSLLVFLGTNSLTLAIAMIILYGFFLSGQLPTLYSLAGDKFPFYPGVTFGAIAASIGLGSGLLPHIIGRISDLPFLDLRGALGSCTIYLVILFVLIWQITGKKTSS